MSDKTSNQDASRNSDAQPSPPPVGPTAVQQSKVGDPGGNNPDHTVANAKKLTAELHWLEKVNITGQIILAIVGIWALIIYSGQLGLMRGTLAEVKSSGEATKQQIWSAIRNMNWMAKSMDKSVKKFSEQASDTHVLAEAAKSQADNTRVLAEQTKTALHVTERAYIVAEAPELRSARRTVKITFNNIGHIPSGRLEIITHEATINLESSSQIPDLKKAAEWHWSQSIERALPPGPGLTVNVPVALLSETKMQQGLQTILIVGKFRYQDGFPDDGVQNASFCFQTLLLTEEKRVVWRGRDAIAILPKMEALDGYPKNGQRDQ